MTVTFKSLIPGLTAITLIGLLVLGPAHADVIAVCTSGCNYTSISKAIDAADPGEIIEVQSGTYKENINIKKEITLQGVDTGEGKPVVDADRRGAAITLSADGIALKGFNITNSIPPIISEIFFWPGIKVLSNHNVIADNTISSNQCGIYLKDSSNNTVTSNSVTDNIEYGIRLSNSSNNTMRYNQILGNGYNFGLEGRNSSHFRNDIDTSNVVDSKPIYYIVGVVDEIIDSYSNAGAVYCIDCNNVSVSDLTVTKNSHGICLYNTSNSRIENNSLSDNFYGVYIQNSGNNAVVRNNASHNYACGIFLINSNNNLLVENNVSSNDENGTILSNSSNNTMRNNIMLSNRYNFGSVAQNTSSLENDIDNTNLVDGKAIYYLVGARDEIIDSHSNAGTVYCIDCNNVSVRNLVFVNDIHGVYFSNTSNSRIENSTLNDNLFGILLEHSVENLIKNNSAHDNRGYGILLAYSISNNITSNVANSNGEEDFRGPEDNYFEYNTFGTLRTDLPPGINPPHQKTHVPEPRPSDSGGSHKLPFYVTSIPGGAEIWVDGEPTGKQTPNKIVFEQRGGHVYELFLSGYEPYKGEFYISSPINMPAIKLTPVQSPRPDNNVSEFYIYINSVPEGATIWIDGESTGKRTPNKIYFDASENHTFDLFLSDHESHHDDFYISGPMSKNVTLTPRTPEITPISYPADDEKSAIPGFGALSHLITMCLVYYFFFEKRREPS